MDYMLYYLADQNDDIHGAKTFTGRFADKDSAMAQAIADGIAHYSIEQQTETGYSIVYVV